METKFTKGEWSISVDCWADGHVSIDGFEHSAIAVVVSEMDDGSKKEELSANAHLIAAAPEMYADIEDDIRELSHELNNKNLTPHTRAHLTNKLNVKTKLLAKARGEQ